MYGVEGVGVGGGVWHKGGGHGGVGLSLFDIVREPEAQGSREVAQGVSHKGHSNR